MAKRLTDKHPAMIALQEVIARMDEKKISLIYGRYGNVQVKFCDEVFDLKDNESPQESISEFPPYLEYKLMVPE